MSSKSIAEYLRREPIETLIGFLESTDKTGNELIAKIDALTAERDQLREALRPFAEEGAEYSPEHPDNMPMYCDNYNPCEYGEYSLAKFTVGDMRRAAALLKGEA